MKSYTPPAKFFPLDMKGKKLRVKFSRDMEIRFYSKISDDHIYKCQPGDEMEVKKSKIKGKLKIGDRAYWCSDCKRVVAEGHRKKKKKKHHIFLIGRVSKEAE